MRPEVLSLFPPCVGGAELTCFAEVDELFEVEQEAIRNAVAGRVREFRAGRHCGREALAALGATTASLPQGADRSPVWPPGVVGSISHCDGYCGAVVGWRRRFAGLGLDVEQRSRALPDLWPLFTTDEEKAELNTQPRDVATERATLIFSAKEAFYKAQYTASGLFLDFQAASVRLSDGGHLCITLQQEVCGVGGRGHVFEGRYSFGTDHVFTAVALLSRGEDTQEYP